MPSTRVDNDTFIHRARRTQIIDAAIEVVAEVGADRASISRIAERAGITRGVVTYHFRDRRSLFAAVVAHVYGLAHGALGNGWILPGVHGSRCARSSSGVWSSTPSTPSR